MSEIDLLKALNEGSNTSGGYLVPEVWATKLYDIILAKSTAIQLCDQVTMTSDTMLFPKVTGQSTAYVVAENATITAADPSFGQLSISPLKYAALTQISSEVMEDSNPAIMEIIMRRLAEDIALKIDYNIYNGTVTTSAFYGFANSTIAGTVTTLTLDAIANAIMAMKSENVEPTDMVCHPRVSNLLRKMKRSTATDNQDYVFVPSQYGESVLMNGQVGKIWGVNVIESTQIPVGTVTTTKLSSIIMVARGKCGVFGSRRAMTINKDYDINTDSWKVQLNTRVAFAMNYAYATYCINGIVTA